MTPASSARCSAREAGPLVEAKGLCHLLWSAIDDWAENPGDATRDGYVAAGCILARVCELLDEVDRSVPPTD